MYSAVKQLASVMFLAASLLLSPASVSAMAEPKQLDRQGMLVLKLEEHLNLAWDEQLVNYPIEFAAGKCHRDSILVTDSQGSRVPFQLSDITYHDSARNFIKSGRVSLFTGLGKLESKQFGVYYRSTAATAPQPLPTDLKINSAGGALLTLENEKMGLQVADGEKTFPTPVLSVDVPAPIAAVRGPDGRWRGKGYLDTYWRVTSYKSELLETGPLFADVRLTYHFEGKRTYQVTIRLSSKADWACVSESMNLGPRNKFVFDCSVNFQPDKLGLLTARSDVLLRDLHYFDDIRQARFAMFSQFSQLHDFRDGLGVCESGSSRDFLGAFLYRPGQWTRPKVNFVEFWEHRQAGDDYLTRDRLTDFGKADAFASPEHEDMQGHSVYQGHFTWEFQLYDGRRQWGLSMTDKSQQFVKATRPRSDHRRGAARLRNQVMQVGACPLDRMKELVLAWPAGPLPAEKPLDADAVKQKRQLLAQLRNFVEGFYYREGWACPNPVSIRGVAPGCDGFDHLRAQGGLTADEDALLRAEYVFLASMLYDPDYYPWDKCMLPVDDPDSTEPLFAGMINQNFNADRFNMVGRIGLSLPTHPESKKWVDHFVQQLNLQWQFYLYPESGCWEESHTYANHVLNTILPMLHKLRTQAGINLFKDERLKRMFDFFVRTVTPLDKNWGTRITPACGDHAEGNYYREIYRTAAEGFATADPKFARRLMWMYRQQGGQEPSAIEAAPQELESEYLRGFGGVLRANDAAGDETFFLLRCGQSWGHHHVDDNSIHLYAKGAPLIADAAKGNPAVKGDWKYGATGHSRINLAEVSIVNALGKYHRGWIQKHRFSPEADYLLGHTPFLDTMSPRKDGNPALITPIHPGWHDRQVLFVRPDYFLIRDTVQTDLYGEEFWLHLDAEQVEQQDNIITAHSKHGVDLDIIFLSPKRVVIEQGSVPGGKYHDRDTPLSTIYIKIIQPPNTPFLYLLYPRKTSQPRPKVEPLPGLVGATVQRGEETDILLLDHEPIEYAQGDVRFQGSVGLVRIAGGKAKLALPDGQQLRWKDQEIQGQP